MEGDPNLTTWQCPCGYTNNLVNNTCFQCNSPINIPQNDPIQTDTDSDVIMADTQEITNNQQETPYMNNASAVVYGGSGDYLGVDIDNENDGFSDGSVGDWSGAEFEDPYAPVIPTESLEKVQERLTAAVARQGNAEALVWACPKPGCGFANSLMRDFQCRQCHTIRAIGDNDRDFVYESTEVAQPVVNNNGLMVMVYACECGVTLKQTREKCYTCGVPKPNNVEYMPYPIEEVPTTPRDAYNNYDRNWRPASHVNKGGVQGEKFHLTHREWIQDRVLSTTDFDRPPPYVQHVLTPDAYPTNKDLTCNFKSPKLPNEFGVPKALPCFKIERQDFWRDSGVSFTECFRFHQAPEILENELKEIAQPLITPNSFSVNDDGFLAILDGSKLSVFEPVDSTYALIAVHEFPNGWRNNMIDNTFVRVRFCDGTIYIFENYRISRLRLATDPFTDAWGLTPLQPFVDPYCTEQNFCDIEVDDRHIYSVWRKWVGIYNVHDFSWFHAVAGSHTRQPPWAIHVKNGYAHVGMGSCVTAFHLVSKEISVLWCFANMRAPYQFCVSQHFGLFATRDGGDIMQSFYNATQTKIVLGPNSRLSQDSADFARHGNVFVDPNLEGIGAETALNKVVQLTFDESYGIRGRLLILTSDYKLTCMVPLSDTVFLCERIQEGCGKQEVEAGGMYLSALPTDVQMYYQIYTFLFGDEHLKWLVEQTFGARFIVEYDVINECIGERMISGNSDVDMNMSNESFEDFEIVD